MTDLPGHPDLILTLRQHISPGTTVPVRTRFRYDPADAFAVRLDFAYGHASAATWVLARELLAEGLYRTSGEGDVLLRPPCRCRQRATLGIYLDFWRTPAVLEAEAAPVRDWLVSTFRLVPAGTEGDHINWDRTLEYLRR